MSTFCLSNCVNRYERIISNNCVFSFLLKKRPLALRHCQDQKSNSYALFLLLTDLQSSSVSATLYIDHVVLKEMTPLLIPAKTTIKVTSYILDDDTFEGDRTFTVSIFNVSAETAVGINQTSVRILDDDRECTR